MDSATAGEAERRERIRQQEVIVDLGQRALEIDDLDQFLREASAAVAETLDAEYASVLELRPDGEEITLRQGVGWPAGLVGEATVPADTDTQAGHALCRDDPVTVDDFESEDRFSGPALLAGRDVESGICTTIGSIEDPWGVLGVHATDRREFGDHDAVFVRSVANVLASAIDNEETRNEIEEIYGRISDAVYALDEEWRFTHVNERAEALIDFSGEGLEGKNIWDTFERAADSKLRREYERAMETQEAASFEFYYPDPLDAWYVVNVYPSETGLSVYFRDVTDRKDRERKLRERERQFRTLAENLNEVIWMTSADPAEFLYLNPVYEDVWGQDRETVYDDGMAFVEAIHPEDRDRVREAYRALPETEYDEEYRLVQPDDDVRWIHATAVPVRDGSGAVERIVGIAEDVTEHKERERELRETKRRLKLAIEGTNTGLWEWALATDEVTWNETLERAIGLEPGSFDGTFEAFTRRVHPDDMPHIESALDQAIETGELYQRELRMRHDDGGWRWAEVRGRVVGDPGSEHMIGIYHDVTRRKAREQQLRDRRQELKRYQEYTDDVLDAIDDVFYVLDEDGGLRRWNASLTGATGYAEAEVAEMHVLDFFDEDERTRIVEAVAEVFESGDARVESAFLTKNGNRVPYEFVATALEDLDGNPVLAGIGRDIGDRVEKERQLSRLIDNIPGLVYRVENAPGWPTEFVSDGVRDITGHSPDAFERGDVTWDEITVGRHEQIWDDVQTALDEREPYHFVFPIETADGERRWVKEQGRGVYADDGSVEALEGVLIDITERVQYERELERTRHLLEQSQRMAAIGAWEIDVRGTGTTRMTVTDEVYRIHGLPPEADFDLEDGSKFYRPEDWQRLRTAIDGAIERGDAYDIEVRLTTAEGEQRWVRTIGKPVFENGERRPIEGDRTATGDGNVVAVRGTFQDVTERKRREEELERTKNLLDHTENLANVGGWEIDVRDGVPYDSIQTEGIYRLHGLPLDEEFPVERGIEFVHPEDRGTVERAIASLLVDDEPFDIERRVLTADGDVRWVRAIGVPVTAAGEVVTYRGAMVDVTDRKRREEELERTKNMLQQAQRMTGVAGWEADVSDGPPYAPRWSGAIYELFEVPSGTPLDVDEVNDFFHLEDPEEGRTAFDRALDGGGGWDHEARLTTAAGNERWVRSIGELVEEDGELVKLRGSIQDITEQKEREFALESLHETTRGLLGAETEDEIAELVVDAAEDALGVPSVAVYLLDADSNRLEPTAFTPGFVELCEGAPAAATRESVLWDAFIRGAATSFTDSRVFGEASEDGLAIPIGNHGVFVVADRSSPIDAEVRQLVETLVATTVAAFDRLESEVALRKRDVELNAQNRRLRQHQQITDIIRRIDQSLIGADSREEIEAAVCERLVEAENVAFAWIGAYDASGTELAARTWAGTGEGYLDAVTLADATTGADPAAIAAREERPIVVPNVVEGLKTEEWRKRALADGFHAVASVPLSFDEYFYGVLAVYAGEPNMFNDLERTVFAELGENIANSINAVEARQALHTDVAVEVTLRFDESDAFLATVAREADTTIEYEGLATHSDDETRLFFTAGGDPTAVATALDDILIVTDHWLVTRSPDRALFGATVAGEVVASRLVRHGGSPQSIRATPSEMTVVVDVPTTVDVREFVEMLRERYPSVELTGRHDTRRDERLRQQRVTSLVETLTDRQREILQTAYLAGFFEWPRESTGEDVAEMLDVSQPTVNRHLRLGQRRLFEQLFGSVGTAAGN
ncbi:PAS domain-containing protein [Halosolutus gelatinilyticus]|uniref:PAS domain-containing protein n=1 Tax=Halosolutus gelatinilyticus TaxID=2931975 RepID=UPI001FF6F8B8|nr:PAS domain-containing protein [Halosolutus gelatinilyticus]